MIIMRRTHFYRSVWFFTILIVVIPLIIFGMVNIYSTRFEPLPILNDNSGIINTGFTTPNASSTLFNQKGKPVSLNNLDQKVIVVNFFFTRCPGICLKMMTNEKKLQQAFINDPELCFLSFSVDPDHDSINVLNRYARLMDIKGNQWQLMTGDKKAIYLLARRRFNLTANEGDGGPQDFIHSDQLVLLDKKRQIRGYYNGTDPEAVNQLITDIKKLKNEK